jgi:hypothetical protein
MLTTLILSPLWSGRLWNPFQPIFSSYREERGYRVCVTALLNWRTPRKKRQGLFDAKNINSYWAEFGHKPSSWEQFCWPEHKEAWPSLQQPETATSTLLPHDNTALWILLLYYEKQTETSTPIFVGLMQLQWERCRIDLEHSFLHVIMKHWISLQPR